MTRRPATGRLTTRDRRRPRARGRLRPPPRRPGPRLGRRGGGHPPSRPVALHHQNRVCTYALYAAQADSPL